MRAAGYLINTREGPDGEPGLFYDYIIAENGLFVRARNPLLEATICVAEASVRGLSPLGEEVRLLKGRIPQYIYELALSILAVASEREHYLAVVWDCGYHLRTPPQEGSAGGVRYEPLPGTVLDIHSHGTMRAFFSGTDNEDEQALRLYMVVGRPACQALAGRLDTFLPQVEMRIGVYGYFAPVEAEEVFE